MCIRDSPNGAAYGKEELTHPTRILTSTVRAEGGRYPRCPVKTAQAVPKEKIVQVMAALDGVTLHAPIRTGQVVSADLQPVFAAQGPQNTGKALTSLTALQELGLIEEQNGHWQPVAVTAKQDLASAPVLQRLAAMAKQG